MPRGCKPTGDHALSNAERQARYRARQQVAPDTAVTLLRHPTDRRSRPQRWRDAVGTLLTLQADRGPPSGSQQSPRASMATRQPTRSKPSSISTWRHLVTLSRRVVTGVIKPTIDRPGR